MQRLGYPYVLSITILALQLWVGQAAPQDATFLGGAPLTIRRNNQCLSGFVGVTSRALERNGENRSTNDAFEFQVHIHLRPGCAGGKGGMMLHGGAWPEFSRNLRFEFELSRELPGQGLTYQPLVSELILNDQPPMRENYSFRTLDFNLKAEKTSAATKELLITIFTDGEKLQTVMIPISAKKPSRNKDRDIRPNSSA